MKWNKPGKIIFTSSFCFGVIIALVLFLIDPNIFTYFGDATSRLVQSRYFGTSEKFWGEVHQLTWLPLPYILIFPFTQIDILLFTGLAGSIIGLTCHSLSSVYIYKSTSGLSFKKSTSVTITLLFALNPALLYISMTAMSEAPAILFLILTIFNFNQYLLYRNKSQLMFISIFAMLGSLCRYELWVLAVIFSLFNLFVSNDKIFKRTLVSFLAISGIFAWLIWNQCIFSDYLYFLHADYYSSGWQAIYQPSGSLVKYDLIASVKLFYIAIVSNNGIFLILISIAGLFFFRKCNFYFLLFLLILPLTIFLLMFSGKAEVSFYGMNFRYFLLSFPAILIFAGLAIDAAFRTKFHIPVLVIVCLLFFDNYIYFLVKPVPRVTSFHEASASYFSTRYNSSMEICSALKGIVTKENILFLTPSGVAHRLILISKIQPERSEIGNIHNSKYQDISFIKKFDILIIFKKSLSDGSFFSSGKDVYLSAMKNSFEEVLNNEHYLLLKKKAEK
ncbi:MAG: family glycosyltransferase, 4-amino-4-deoxy-L-arabinose transferase [Ignavibacteria bacterium]|nr:family glycosyltransferase, 4-amino-4-deoxy-L-arabinose transferase [Ignavibacteria bacterium]